MEREIHQLWSSNLTKNMDLAVYGHFGLAVLLFPTNSDDCLENEENGLIKSIEPFIKSGKCKVFSVSNVGDESWSNPDLSPEEKSLRQLEYDYYITDELVPIIFRSCGGPVPIITCGASTGAFHAANNYFRRPDLFLGVIAMSGTYNLEKYSGTLFDDNCYFNSPIHFLPGLHDDYWLSFLKNKHHVYIASGSGQGENPADSLHIKEILDGKQIPNHVDIWGPEFAHEWRTWREMIKYYVGSKL